MHILEVSFRLGRALRGVSVARRGGGGVGDEELASDEQEATACIGMRFSDAAADVAVVVVVVAGVSESGAAMVDAPEVRTLLACSCRGLVDRSGICLCLVAALVVVVFFVGNFVRYCSENTSFHFELFFVVVIIA